LPGSTRTHFDGHIKNFALSNMGKDFTSVPVSKFRVGHAGAASYHHEKRADAACAKGGFYTNPTNGQSISASSPLNISWDSTCLNTQTVDIYLYAPGQAKSLLHEWENVNFATGNYMATLQPRWWNSSSSMNLQLAIVESGTGIFMSPFPAGPVFTATYTAPAGATPTSADPNDSEITDVNSSSTKHGLAGGKVAAAVIMPLLVIIGLCIGAYLKLSRSKAQEKRKRWSEAVDKRMSTISTDWKSMSAAGASAAIRNSVAVSNGGNRASSFSFGAIRPSSQYTVDGGNPGIGAQGTYTPDDGDMESAPRMSQLRGSRPGSVALSERISRVSFAADPRPSVDRRTIVSRAYHSAYIPPVPTRRDSDELSPTQTQGPFSLSQEDIRARVSAGDDVDDVDDYMPALSMMRTGAQGSNEGDDYILPSRSPSPEMPAPPSPTHQNPNSPVLGMMSMQPMPGNVMSPDEMLRAYATRNVTSPTSSPGSLTFPLPVANYNGNGMRTLYSPTTPVTALGSAMPALQDIHQPPAYDEEDNEDAYGATAL
jgi:hypothetical protein